MIVRCLQILLSGSILVGCGAQLTIPDYTAKEKERPHGYSEQDLGEQRYLVTYESYKEFSLDQIEQFALRRSAELAVEKGMVGFDVEEKLCASEYRVEDFQDVSTNLGNDAIPIAGPSGFSRHYDIKYCALRIRLFNAVE